MWKCDWSKGIDDDVGSIDSRRTVCGSPLPAEMNHVDNGVDGD